ncbi:hypothetical protein [Salegentibacter sp. F14]
MLKFIKYFTDVKYEKKLFRYRVAVGIVFKKLRIETTINNKPLIQQALNDKIQIKYNKTWNAAREESLPNTTLENLYLMCDFFELSFEELFRRIDNISATEIDDTIRQRSKLSRLYKDI